MKAIVFDMDGVLFDTEKLCMDSWIYVGEKMGLSGIGDVFMQCIGLNATATKALLLEQYGEDFPNAEFGKRTSRWFHDYIEKKGLPIKPGVKKILSFLQKEGYVIGLASSTRYETVVKHLKDAGIIDYFSVIVGGDMIERSKPCPDIYLLACKKLGAEPGETYAIEDSPNGIRAANAAGMKAIMVPDMVLPDAEMKRLSHTICQDLNEVVKYLEETIDK